MPCPRLSIDSDRIFFITRAMGFRIGGTPIFIPAGEYPVVLLSGIPICDMLIRQTKADKPGKTGGETVKNRLIQVAQEAGAFFRRDELTDVVSKEGHANYVTNIDCKVQAFLEKELLQLLPGSEFIGEEKENQDLTDEPTWIVDPLDGTTNMIHDYRMSAVSIALCRNKKPVIGLVWQPFTQELFYAEEGRGAFLNDRPIHVSDTPFRNALVAVGTAPYYEELEDTGMKLASEFLHQCADIRRSGSAALDLAYLACGRHDIFFELRLKPWDYAAGSLIVQEAGGLVQMPLADGTMDYNLSTAILSANSQCMPTALKVFRETVLPDLRKE